MGIEQKVGWGNKEWKDNNDMRMVMQGHMLDMN